MDEAEDTEEEGEVLVRVAEAPPAEDEGVLEEVLPREDDDDGPETDEDEPLADFGEPLGVEEL